MLNIHDMMQLVFQVNASDLHLVVGAPPCLRVDGILSPIEGEPTLTTERAQETLEVVMAELLRLAEGIAQDELDRLKAKLKSSLIMQQESSPARSNSIAADWYHLGRVQTVDEVRAIIDGLSRDRINLYLASHPPRDFRIVTVGEKPLEMPVGIS